MDQFKHFVEQEIPFNRFLGLKVDTMGGGGAKLVLPFRPELVGDARRPALHGGVISMLIDTCGGVAVWSACNPEDRIATIDLRVDYLRPAPPKDLAAEAEVKLLGNRVANCHIKVHTLDDPGTIIAEGRGVYNVRKG